MQWRFFCREESRGCALMKLLDEILSANVQFRQNLPKDYSDEDVKKSKLPNRHLAIITCMDTRLVEFLEPALGIRRGEAKIIKTAGNGVTGMFDGTIRSLLVCVFELGVREVMVIGHQECGMAHASSKELMDNMKKRGISGDAIRMIQPELEKWVDDFHHPVQNIEDTVWQIRMNPLIPQNIPVHGLLFHPRTGEVNTIVDGYEELDK